MKLIIQLDEKFEKFDINDNEIILTNDYKYYCRNKEKNNIVLVDFSLADEDPELSNQINNLFESLPNDYLRYRNTFYDRVFRPMYSIIIQIENIIEKLDIKELVLMGGSNYLFLSLKFAEGEGCKKWFKTSWFLNSIIYNYFKERINICWLNKESAIKLAVINYFREKLFLYLGILRKIIKSVIIQRIPIINYKFNSKKIPVICLVNKSLQFNHLYSFLSEIKNIEPLFIGSYNNQLKRNKKIILRRPIGLLSLFKLLLNDSKLKRIDSKNLSFNLANKKIEISGKSFKRALELNHFLFCLELMELTKNVKKLYFSKTGYIVTNMTFGEDIILCKEFAKKMGMKHINLQYVAMGKMLFPQMDLADKYYLYSKKTFELYKKYSSSYKYYLPIKMSPKDHNNSMPNILKIAIFTQPDQYTDQYLRFIELLSNRLELEKIPVKIIIKPHHRQNKIDKFEKITSSYNFIKMASREDICEDIILNSDVTVSMTSSVLFEALNLGKMALIVDLDNKNQWTIYNNDICYPEVNFVVKSIEDIIDIIKKYPKYRDKYIERYEQFIKNNKEINNYEMIFSEY